MIGTVARVIRSEGIASAARRTGERFAEGLDLFLRRDALKVVFTP